jgi:hypothetical protein
MSSTESVLHAPVFIVGHPRSGTSLLAAMLGRNPEVLALPETHFFNEVRYALAPHYSKGPDAVASRLQATRMRHLPLGQVAVRNALAGAEMSPKGVFDAILIAMLMQSGRHRIVEKTPVHIRHIDDILAMWPDAHVIWIVRDGRAAISSLRKLDWASKDLSTLARQWTRNMRFAISAHDSYPAQVTRVEYEDLISCPEDVLLHVCRRIELRYDRVMLDHNQPTQTVSSFEDEWKANVGSPMIASRASAWREELRPDEIIEIEAIIGPLLVNLGYLTSRPGSLRALLEGVRERAVNSALGLRVQMVLYDFVAARRFAPSGANQANTKRR